MKRTVWIAVGLVVGIGLIGVVSVAAAEGDGAANQGPWRHGIVIELHEEGLLLKTPRGEVTVSSGGRTRYRIPGVEEPGLDDLEVGDHIGVAGRWEKDGVLLARLIVRLPGREEVGRLFGELTAKGDDWMENTRRDGAVSGVLVGERTRYRIPGVADPGLDDLQIGDRLYVRGLWNDDRELEARLVVRLPDGVEAILLGKVTRVDAPTIEVLTRQGPDVVITDETTRFFVPGIENPSLADIAADDIILAGGVREDDGLHALIVAVTPERLARAIRRGTVVALDGSAFTLETPNGDRITVTTDEQTRFGIPGVEEPGIGELQVGFQAVAAGLLDPAGGTLEAWLVGARPAPADAGPDPAP